MKPIHSNVWYADEKRAKSPKKLLFYSDKGSLSVNENAVNFKGKLRSLEINRVSRIAMKHPMLNWLTYLLGALACILLDLILGSEITGLMNTNWALTKFYIFLAPICIILFWLPLRWVVVEYNTGTDNKKAYFSSGKLNGWAALFGANRKLKLDLEEKVNALQNNPG